MKDINAEAAPDLLRAVKGLLHTIDSVDTVAAERSFYLGVIDSIAELCKKRIETPDAIDAACSKARLHGICEEARAAIAKAEGVEDPDHELIAHAKKKEGR